MSKLSVAWTDEDLGVIRAALRVAVNAGSPHMRPRYQALLERVEQQRPTSVKRQRPTNASKTPDNFQAPWLKRAIRAGLSEADLKRTADSNGMTLKQVCEALLHTSVDQPAQNKE